MANAIAKTHAPRGAVTILHAVDAFSHAFENVVEWYKSYQTRNELSQLSDEQLEDVGLTRADISKF
ncbi:DUF1127 domain-containing protein [Ruegeria sp. SCSIO 43209]|jgi:uncharacterized protein YjiS (DUF1127 family)|uniref:DUF1127 domain-containing protein n=1 Tax=Ruegeria sp. SCSIO 43209 TaxID=2793010 RepID=UPI00147ADB1A|nr:DUF1127 domain-containing protein [Ruegeria sp. SCSIO 43209]UAB88813.1 DUF1127 domain-containing protein [Ruegeria sp. SCSIO 43209]